MNLSITSQKSNPFKTKDLSFVDDDNIVLFRKSLNAQNPTILLTKLQKPARLFIANDNTSLSGFCYGENFNVNSYVDRRLPPGRDPCGHRRRKQSGGLRL